MITKETLTNLISINDLPKSPCLFKSKNTIEKFLEIMEVHKNYETIIKADFGIFGLPTKESIKPLVEYIGNRNVVEVGCGVGYLSYCLKKANPELDIIAVDNFSSTFCFDNPDQTLKKFKLWFPITEMNAIEYVKNLHNIVVIMNWADLDSSFAFDIASNLPNDNELIYIGESFGGCTADDDFFENFTLKKLNIPWFSWYGLHDNIYKVEL